MDMFFAYYCLYVSSVCIYTCMLGILFGILVNILISILVNILISILVNILISILIHHFPLRYRTGLFVRMSTEHPRMCLSWLLEGGWYQGISGGRVHMGM